MDNETQKLITVEKQSFLVSTPCYAEHPNIHFHSAVEARWGV